MMAVMCTSNPIHNYNFSWTIENFSRLIEKFEGPTFSRIPGVIEDLSFEIQLRNKRPKYTLDVILKALMNDINSRVSVSSNISILKTDDTIIKKQLYLNFKLLPYGIILLNYNSPTTFSSHMNLVDDQLVVKGTLSFSQYRITSNVSSPVVKTVSEASCELVKYFKALSVSGFSSDFTFVVGELKLSAHKFILRSRSPVFARMFDSDMLENKSNKVVIEDADVHVFNCFLMFLYTGLVEDKDCDTLLQLYSLAHKYQIKSLHAVCSGLLASSLTIDSACNVLMLSDLHGDEQLKDVAKTFIRDHIRVLGTDDWAEIITSKPQLLEEVMATLASPIATK